MIFKKNTKNKLKFEVTWEEQNLVTFMGKKGQQSQSYLLEHLYALLLICDSQLINDPADEIMPEPC